MEKHKCSFSGLILNKGLSPILYQDLKEEDECCFTMDFLI